MPRAPDRSATCYVLDGEIKKTRYAQTVFDFCAIFEQQVPACAIKCALSHVELSLITDYSSFAWDFLRSRRKFSVELDV